VKRAATNDLPRRTAALRARRRLGARPSRQRGIALLVAILLVALGTIIAAAVAYENAMTARRGAATLAFDEGVLIGQGAEALAAYAIRTSWQQDKNSVNTTQVWAMPVGPIEIVPGVMLDASIEDLSGRFNLNSLVKDDGTGTVDPVAQAAFVNLLQSLKIDTKWAGYIIDWIDPNIAPETPDGAEDTVYMGQTPPYLTANQYITSTTELLALPGFGRDNYNALAPYITALPPDAKVNVCTAPGEVLDAFLAPGTSDWGGPNTPQLLKNRQGASGCFPQIAKDYQPTFEAANFAKASGEFAQTSKYFRLTSHITIGTTEFNLYSLLYREDSNGTVRAIQRSYSPD
jgi:general secretion pathway protein K